MSRRLNKSEFETRSQRKPFESKVPIVDEPDAIELHEFSRNHPDPDSLDSEFEPFLSFRSRSPQPDSEVLLDNNEIELGAITSTEDEQIETKDLDHKDSKKEDGQKAEPAPTELKFSPNLIPSKKIPVYSLEAEITTLLAKLSYRIVELAKRKLASEDPNYQVDELKGIDWNPFLTQKYGCFVFTLLAQDQPSYWNKVEDLFVNVFGEDEAKSMFDDLMCILPDGVTIIAHRDDETSPIMYEYTALYNLEGILASAKQYIDDEKRKHPDKFQSIQKIIDEKYRQVTNQIQFILEKPYEAQQAFNLKLFVEGGKIHHNNHDQLFKRIVLQFEKEVLAQLSHLEPYSHLPDDHLFYLVSNKFNKYKGLMKQNNIILSSDLLHIYFTSQGLPHTIFYNVHQSPTQAQKSQDLADQKKSSTHILVDDEKKDDLVPLADNGSVLPPVSINKLLKLESQANAHSELNRLPYKCKTTHGIWWQDPATGLIEVQVGIESTKFHTPLTKTVKTTNPHHLAINVLLNLQQQAQEARKNKIVSYLLNYNEKGSGEFLSLSFIQGFSLFLSQEISAIIDGSVNRRTPLSSHNLFQIMQTAIEKFKIQAPGTDIPQEVLFTLAGAATEIAYSRTIYTHVLNLNDKTKYQYDALRMAQYWMEYPSVTGLEPTHPGFIYIVWPITDEFSVDGSIGDIKPHITRLNEASLIELFLLFKKYFFEDSMVEVTQSLDFKPYFDLRIPMIAAANQYHLNLITPFTPQSACKVVVLINRELNSLDTEERESVVAGHKIFILEKQNSYQLCFEKGKKIQSKLMRNQEVFPNLTFMVMKAKEESGSLYIQLDEKDSEDVFKLCESLGGSPRKNNEEIKAAELRRQQEIIDSLAEFKVTEKAFFDSVQPIFLKVQEKILDSKPTTEAGMVLRLLFKEILKGYFKNGGLIPALIHLLVFFMNERDGLSLQAAGGSDGSDDWLQIEKIFNTLKLYGFNRDKLTDLERGPTKDLIPILKRRSGRRIEMQAHTQLPSNDLLRLSANNHPFFQFWLDRKPSSALQKHTNDLYQYCASHWLSLEKRLALIKEIKITEEYPPKDREDLSKLSSFYQREARKIEVQLLESKESKYESTPSNNPLAEAIDRFYKYLTHYLRSKRGEITFYCSEYNKDMHPQLEKILNELAENQAKENITLLEKFKFIETCNYLGLELSAIPIERSSHLFKSKYHHAVEKYACLNPVRSFFIVISSLDFSTQEKFILSLNSNLNRIHPNDIYRCLFKMIPYYDSSISSGHWVPDEVKLLSQELERVKKYCDEGDLDLINTEIKIPFKTSEPEQENFRKLQIYWQQQRLLHYIIQEERSEFKLSQNLSTTIVEFYNHFRKLIPHFKKDLKNCAEVARICKEHLTVTDKYNFIIELYYLGQLNIQNKNKIYKSIPFSNIIVLTARYLQFNNADKFLSSLRSCVMGYVANPQDPYQDPASGVFIS